MILIFTPTKKRAILFSIARFFVGVKSEFYILNFTFLID
jgi:hypothetical protein